VRSITTSAKGCGSFVATRLTCVTGRWACPSCSALWH
jgi:hypothetical protein